MFSVYLLASKPYGTLYVGVISDLAKRIWEHKHKAVPGFTISIRCRHPPVWFKGHDAAEAAIRRKKQIKEWKRDWKISLIESDNPRWIDLFPSLSR